MQCELHGSVSSEVPLLAEPDEVDVPVDAVPDVPVDAVPDVPVDAVPDVPVDAVPDVDVDEVALLQTTLFPLAAYLL